MNLYHLEQAEWSEDILQAIRLDPVKLPAIHLSTDVVGEVMNSVSEDIGIAAGTPVVIGGGDGSCAATGAGVIREGAAYNYIGSSSWIGLATKKPIYDPEMRTFNWAHLVPDLYSPNGTMQTAGGSYQWTRDQLCSLETNLAKQSGISPYELMNQKAEQSPPGARGLIFMPYLLGERCPRWNPNARGAFVGLTMSHTRSDMIRAVLEGIALNLRVILEAFQNQGAKIDAMRVIGGGAQSRLWNQIMANVYGVKIIRLAMLEEATSLGAAIAGGVGVGLFPDFTIAEKLTPIASVFEVQPEEMVAYTKTFEIFEATYAALEPIYEQLAET